LENPHVKTPGKTTRSGSNSTRERRAKLAVLLRYLTIRAGFLHPLGGARKRAPSARPLPRLPTRPTTAEPCPPGCAPSGSFAARPPSASGLPSHSRAAGIQIPAVHRAFGIDPASAAVEGRARLRKLSFSTSGFRFLPPPRGFGTRRAATQSASNRAGVIARLCNPHPRK